VTTGIEDALLVVSVPWASCRSTGRVIAWRPCAEASVLMLPSTLLGRSLGRKRRLCVPWAFHSSDWHTLLVYYQHTSHIQYTHRGGRSLRPHLRLCFGHTTPYAHAAGPFGRVRKSPLVAILATSTVGKKAGSGITPGAQRGGCASWGTER